jgi:predicted amidophosphoribosyltransferase
MPEMLWKKFDFLDQPVFLSADDDCYYARDYISHARFDASDGNNLLTNFKKPVSKRGSNQWKYKLQAIERFARELLTILPDNAVVGSVPTSKSRTDPEFDSRLDDVLIRLNQLKMTIRIERPIDRAATAQAVHHGGTRSIDEICTTLQWNGFQTVPGAIVLIDDVITCGTHFKACQRLIQRNHPGLKVYGVFWARTVWTVADAPA